MNPQQQVYHQSIMQQQQPSHQQLVPIMAIPIQSANKFNIRILFDQQSGQPVGTTGADASGFYSNQGSHQLVTGLPPPQASSAVPIPNSQQRVVVQADVHQPQQAMNQQWYQANSNGIPTTVPMGDNRVAYTTSIPTSVNGSYIQPQPLPTSLNTVDVTVNGSQSNVVLVNNDYQQQQQYQLQQANYKPTSSKVHSTVIQQYAEEPQAQEQQSQQQQRKRVTFVENAETIENPPPPPPSPPHQPSQVEQHEYEKLASVPVPVPVPALQPLPPMPENSPKQPTVASASSSRPSNNKNQSAPPSSFDHALKENYKTYAKRSAPGVAAAAAAPSEKENNADGGQLKMTEVLASLMAPQETRVGLEANVRVALLSAAGRHVMIKIGSQNGVTGIMEPAVYTALTDVSMTCAVMAEKARNASHVVTFSGEELGELLAADRRLDKTASSLKKAGLVLSEAVCVFDGDKWHVGTQCLDIVYRKAALTVAKSAVIVVLRPLNRLSPVQEFSGQVCSHILSQHPSGLQQPATGEGLLTQKFASDPLITVAEAARRSYAEIVGFTLYGCI